MDEDLAKCGHIKNLWRRQFCGMVVGLDRYHVVQHTTQVVDLVIKIMVTQIQIQVTWTMKPKMITMMMTTMMMMMTMTTRGIARLVSEAELILGPNTVVVVTPDNGGSVWFVALNFSSESYRQE